MKEIALFLSLIALIVACKKSSLVDCRTPTNDLAICKELIIGKWAWEKNIQYISGYKVSTPQTAGISQNLNFKANGIVETYINGVLKDTSSYEIYDGNKYFKLDSGLTFLTFREYRYVTPRSVIVRICEDSLYLPYEALIYHTGNDYYSRVK
jgi:hypothetical protein